MDFEFFENLSKDETDAFLRRFLEEESSNIRTMEKQCAAAGIKMDYSIESIPPFIRWVVKKLKTIPQEPDPEVPEWIRNTESHIKYSFEFDDPSKTLILQAAYYFGESFVRSHKSLRWSTGDTETAEANMPVVAGFEYDLELAPILVVDNLLAALVAEPDKSKVIEECVEIWNRDA
jgi:hypothetical protein